jgi:transcriptional regulator with XRE-family HTH domain
MLDELGAALKEARESAGASLQAIAEASRISAAYLQKLERGMVGTPSPRVLRRVAHALDLDYLHLMELADYLQGVEVAEAARRPSPPRPHPLANQSLSAEEWRAVGAFIQTLKAQRGPAGG